MRVLWAFIKRDMAIAFSYRFQAFFQVASMFSVSVTFFFVSLMLRRVEGSIDALAKYGGSYFAFVLVGLAKFANGYTTGARISATICRVTWSGGRSGSGK